MGCGVLVGIRVVGERVGLMDDGDSVGLLVGYTNFTTIIVKKLD